jgi:diguanylate cyclase (GGDEF)-like protein/PAS domain S-box-containing protein
MAAPMRKFLANLRDKLTPWRLTPRAVALLAAMLVGALGVLVLMSWAIDIPAIKCIRPTWPPMAPLTALEFSLAGICLGAAVSAQSRSGRLMPTAHLLGLVVALIAVLRLCADVFDFPRVPDLLGLRDPMQSAQRDSAQMTPLTAVTFVLLGSALSMLGSSRRVGVFQALTLTAALLGLLGLSRYLYDGSPLLPYREMSAHTAAGVLLLSIGVLCARENGGLMGLLRSDSAGGLLARRLLLPMLVMPFIMGWLRLQAQQAGWFGTEAGVSLFALANGITLSLLVWITALVIHRSDLKRGQIEAAMHEHGEEFASARKRAAATQADLQLFRVLLDRSNDLIYIADADSGRILDCNATLPRRLGYTVEELRQMRVRDFSTAAGATSWQHGMAMMRKAGSAMRESNYRCKDGTLFPVEVSLNYVAHEPFPLLFAVIRDVTERQRHERRIASLTQTLKMQSAINSSVLRIVDRDQMLQEACQLAVRVGSYEQAIISLVEPGGRSARPAYQGGKPGFPSPPAEFPIGSESNSGATGRALRTGEVVIANVRHADSPVLVRDRLLSAGIHWIIALPLIVDGERLGALTLSSANPEPIRDEELIVLQDIAATLGFGLRSQYHAKTAKFLEHYDALTGLAKRALFCERLNTLLEHSATPLAMPLVAVVDVHDLSGVNDTFGRNVGDILVQRVAERMRLVLESDECIGYLGGGTFVLAVRQVPSAADSVVAAVDNVVFEEPFSIEGRSFRVSCHSGTARYPVDATDAATLVERAEAALRHAKESGEQSVHFRLQMHDDVAQRLQLENRLREALDAQQFVLHYQPQVNLVTGRIESVEALLRWQEPEEDLAAPNRFLPVLESSGLIVPVGLWALKQAAEDCARWRLHHLGPLRVGVNVSSLQIRRRKFVEDVLHAIEGLDAEGYGVDIEITETVLLQDLDDARRKLHRLREAGVRIAIDDFGTGYSSLGLLPSLPVDILKIDRVFIKGLPEDAACAALTSSIIRIASALGLATVAEGVETPAQLQLLRSFLCTQSQGYLHARPMPAEGLERLLAREQTAAHSI